MSVKKGDTILVAEATLTTAEKAPVDIKWKQDKKERDAKYVETSFSRTDKPAPAVDEGRIFIQADMMEASKKLTVADQAKYTIIVDTDFEYGQKDKTGKGRFLVFHDKSSEIFQHRFLKGIVLKYGEKAGEVAKQFGFEGASGIMSDVGSLFGDELHPF
ncbi:hypothetical protein B0H16DRAFT_1302880 [Mycena metata]|uniref:Uncharacterized protein n=1 Tax=Mycena metata TaxID=1033252 RepID=A0AAD7JZT2_9AGAR|nr:hypothetical protein B0H16DRAFT_1302880 [Mycena metata]